MAAPKKAVGPKSDKLWRDALMRAVRRVEEGTDAQYLDRLADTVVKLGLQGEPSAYKEIGDRLDGKPHQTTELTVVRQRAEELSDDELAGYIASDGSEGTAPQAIDPSQLN